MGRGLWYSWICESMTKCNLRGNVMNFQRLQLMIVVASIGTVTVPASVHAYTAEQQRLCSDEAMRLCSADVPDVDRITACMQRQRALLSEGCKSVFRIEKAEASSRARKSDR